MPSKRTSHSPRAMSTPAAACYPTMACAFAGVLLAATAFTAWHEWSMFARMTGGTPAVAAEGAPDLSLYLLCGVALLMLPAAVNGRFGSRATGRGRHVSGTGLTAAPLSAARMFLTLGILVQSLAPFDFVAGTDQLHAGLRRTAWLFIPGVLSGCVERFTWACAAETILAPDVVVYLVLGLLAACAGREQRLPWRHAWSDAHHQIIILAMVAGTLEMFVVTRHLAMASIVVKGLVGMAGARLAAAIPMLVCCFPSAPVEPRSASGCG